MTPSPLPFKTHDGWSAPRTQIYWSSTPYSYLGIPTNPWNDMAPLTPQNFGRRSDFRAQELSGMGHPDIFSMGIPTVIKGDILGTRHQGIPSFNKNKYIQAIIPHWQGQSCSSNHNTSKVLPESTPQPSKKRKEVSPTTSPVLSHTGPTDLDKNPPMGYRYRSSDKQHRIHNSNSHTMVRRL